MIDFHTHINTPRTGFFGPNMEKNIDKSPQELLSTLSDASVSKAVVMCQPQKYDDYKKSNMQVLDQCKKFKNLIPFYWVNPRNENVEFLEMLAKEKRIFGLKFHPVIDGFTPEHPIIDKFIELSIKYALVNLIHTGWGHFGDPLRLERIGEQFPDAKIVIAHMIEKNSLYIAKKFDNFYVETSYAAHPRRIEEACKLLGAEKILFGSDDPYSNLLFEKYKIQLANISKDDKLKILGENANTILGGTQI